jgi:FtsZ-interacting cell division protein ZipA
VNESVKPALEKFLIIAATLAAIGLFVFVAMWSSIKEKKTQMDDLFNNTNVPTSFYPAPAERGGGFASRIHAGGERVVLVGDEASTTRLQYRELLSMAGSSGA